MSRQCGTTYPVIQQVQRRYRNVTSLTTGDPQWKRSDECDTAV